MAEARGDGGKGTDAHPGSSARFLSSGEDPRRVAWQRLVGNEARGEAAGLFARLPAQLWRNGESQPTAVLSASVCACVHVGTCVCMCVCACERGENTSTFTSHPLFFLFSPLFLLPFCTPTPRFSFF